MSYDETNIFARILRQEVPAQKIYENESALAFHDVNPKAPVHVLIIPKGKYCHFHDFYGRAESAEITGFSQAVCHVVSQLGLEKEGYRVVSNCGVLGGQEVPHFHLHILSGRPLSAMG